MIQTDWQMKACNPRTILLLYLAFVWKYPAPILILQQPKNDKKCNFNDQYRSSGHTSSAIQEPQKMLRNNTD